MTPTYWDDAKVAAQRRAMGTVSGMEKVTWAKVSHLTSESWVKRAAALAGLVLVFRVFIGFVMQHWPTHSGLLRMALYGIVLGAALWWGIHDGRNDPERQQDLTVLWLKAAAGAALGGAVLAWILGLFPNIETGGNSLIFELTSGASFILLSIFVPAIAGAAIGRYLIARESTPA